MSQEDKMNKEKTADNPKGLADQEKSKVDQQKGLTKGDAAKDGAEVSKEQYVEALMAFDFPQKEAEDMWDKDQAAEAVKKAKKAAAEAADAAKEAEIKGAVKNSVKNMLGTVEEQVNQADQKVVASTTEPKKDSTKVDAAAAAKVNGEDMVKVDKAEFMIDHLLPLCNGNQEKAEEMWQQQQPVSRADMFVAKAEEIVEENKKKAVQELELLPKTLNYVVTGKGYAWLPCKTDCINFQAFPAMRVNKVRNFVEEHFKDKSESEFHGIESKGLEVWADPGYVNDVGDGPVLLDPKMPLKDYGLKSNFVLQVVENGGDPNRPLPSLGSIEPTPESEISSQPSDDDEEDYSSVEEEEEKPQPRRNPVRACRKKQEGGVEESKDNMANDEESKNCVLCGGLYEWHGSNPYPLANEGRCCDNCNRNKVVPAQFAAAGVVPH